MNRRNGPLAAVLMAGCVAAGAAASAGAKPAALAPLERVSAPQAQLRAERPLTTPQGGSIERYRQFSGGLPVIGAEAVIANPGAGASILVGDTTVDGVAKPEPVEIGAAGATRRAEAAAEVVRRRAPATAKLGIDPHSGATVWEVIIPSAEPQADFSVFVDAADGEVIRIHDMLHRATASAALFNPNAVVANGGANGLRDAKDKDSALLTSLRTAVTLERITSAKGCLSGTYADVRLGAGRRAKPVCSASFDFSGVTRSQNQFEALMAYFHIDRTRAYVDSLGLTEPLRQKPQKVEANSFSDDNSFFSPGTRTVAFGTGGVDDGEDADVIVHEYGHSLQDQAARFFGERLEGASMGEGFGDYIAAVMSSRTTGPSKFDACMFEWDATSYTTGLCARRADADLTKQKGLRRCFDDPHCVGLGWSGALWELRGLLGADLNGQSVMDRVVFESHLMLSRRSNFKAGAKALIAADALLYGGANGAAIEAEMKQRGFL